MKVYLLVESEEIHYVISSRVIKAFLSESAAKEALKGYLFSRQYDYTVISLPIEDQLAG